MEEPEVYTEKVITEAAELEVGTVYSVQARSCDSCMAIEFVAAFLGFGGAPYKLIWSNNMVGYFHEFEARRTLMGVEATP